MNKKYLVSFICIILTTLCGFGQTRSMKDLIGKWRQTSSPKNKDTVEFMFVNDTTFVVKDVKGHYTYVNRYHFDFSQDPIVLTSLHKNTNGDYITSSLKFIDDNTLIYKFLRAGSHDNTQNPKNDGLMFAKVDNKDYSRFANPTLSSLRGAWRYDSFKSVNFINDTLATLKDNAETSYLYNYTVDFTKFPYWVDFKSLENRKPLQGLFMFPTDSTMIFETFKVNKRKSYFSFSRYIYLKLDSVKKAMILKRKQAR